MSLTFYIWSNIPHPYVFLSFKTINFSTTCKAVARQDGQRSYQNITFDGSCSKTRSDTELLWLKKTKLSLTLNLSGALIHYWFVNGEITGSGPIILIMSHCSPLYYDWGEDITIVWEQSSFFCTSDFLTKLGYVHHRVLYIDAPNALRQCTAPKEKITMFCIAVLQLVIDSTALRKAWLCQEKNLT